MKEIEKYVGYYLLVYLVVLAICGFFQYMMVCQGQSLACAISMSGVNAIITTTAYIVTPIVAIIGFLNWKEQKQYDLEKHYAENILNNINKIHSYLHMYYHQINMYTHTKSDDSKLEDYEKIETLQKRHLISSKFKTLQGLLNVPLSNDLLENFENETLSFITAIKVARKDELPFPSNKRIVNKVFNAKKIIIIDRYETLSEYHLCFNKAYDDLTLKLIKIIKPKN